MQYYYFYDKNSINNLQMIVFLSQCDEFEQTNCGMTQKTTY